MVTVMDPKARNAAFAVARAEAYEKSLANHSVVARSAPATVSHGITDTDVEQMIAEAFEARQWRHEATLEATGIALGQVRDQLRAEFEEKITALQADFEILKAHRGNRLAFPDDDTVIDLPNFRNDRRAG